MIVAADVGATKTDLGIYFFSSGPFLPLVQEEVRSKDYPSLQALVAEFLKKAKMPVQRACFDVPGTVINGRVKTGESKNCSVDGFCKRSLNSHHRLCSSPEPTIQSVYFHDDNVCYHSGK